MTLANRRNPKRSHGPALDGRRTVPRCVIVLVAIAAVVVVVTICLVQEHARGDYQERFIRAMVSGRLEEVIPLIDPDCGWDKALLKKEMDRIRATFGEVQCVREPVFGTWSNCHEGVLITECASVVQFEKGDAECRLILRNGRVTGMNFTTDQLMPAQRP
jgi:hypothetical protein